MASFIYILWLILNEKNFNNLVHFSGSFPIHYQNYVDSSELTVILLGFESLK